MKPGTYVYFIQAGDERGPVKIGYSCDVEKRLESLQTGNHLSCRVIAKFPHADAPEIERKLHSRFANQRLEGEWFSWSDRIGDLIAAWSLLKLGPATTHDERIAREPHVIRIVDRTKPHIQERVTFDAWAVEWSHAQGCFHIQPISESLSMAIDVLLLGRGCPNDYVIVAIARSAEDANQIADSLEPCLRAMRVARLIDENAELPTWWMDSRR